MDQSSSLVDFLNNGILPFVGRKNELNHLLDFCYSTIDGNYPRSILITGEAGIGKSRLVSELSKSIENNDGVVITVKFRPGSSIDLISILFEEISRLDFTKSLLKKTSTQNLSSIIESLERLVRLRITVLIIEDIHLLNENSFNDFTNLLKSLEDSPITVIFTARPIDYKLKNVIEEKLIDEIVLHGLSISEINDVNQTLFGEIDKSISNSIKEKTLGNPLIIRSAIRHSISNNQLTQRINGTWKVEKGFSSMINISVDILSEGMASHLHNEEISAANLIACLGESFAKETALAILNGDEQLFKSLVLKGIISQSHTVVPPINNQYVSIYPVYAFTHSLLHKHFLINTKIESEILIKVLSNGLPNYSFLIYELIHKSNFNFLLDSKDYISAITRIGNDSFAIELTDNWIECNLLLNTFEDILSKVTHLINCEELNKLRSVYNAYKLGNLVRERHTQKFVSTAFEGCCLAKQIDGGFGVWMYFNSFINLIIGRIANGEIIDLYVAWAEIKTLFENDSTLKFRPGPYDSIFLLLNFLMSSGRENYNSNFIIEDVYEFITQSKKANKIDKNYLEFLNFNILIYLNVNSIERYNELLNFGSKFQKASIDTYGLGILPLKLEYNLLLGEFKLIQSNLDILLSSYGFNNLQGEDVCIYKAASEIALGSGIYESTNNVIINWKLKKQPYSNWFKYDIISVLSHIILLRLEPELLLNFKNICEIEISEYDFTSRIFYHLNSKKLNDVLNQIYMENQNDNLTNFSYILICKKDIDNAYNCFKNFSYSFFPITFQISKAAVYLLLIKYYLSINNIDFKRFQNEIEILLEKCFVMFKENKLDYLLKKWLEEFKIFLPVPKIKNWQNEILLIKKFHINEEKLKAKSVSNKLTISLINNFKYRQPNEKIFIKFQGGRVKQLIGAIVIQEILLNKLDEKEFIRLVLNERDVSENSKHSLNVVTSRLTKILGENSIITFHETPIFNTDLIKVDVLEINKNIKIVGNRLKKGNIIGSLVLLLQTLDMWSGDVVFPTLYDEIFEDVRTDFESNIRLVVLKATQKLIDEKDLSNAQKLINKYLSCVDEDEYFLELYSEVLYKLNLLSESNRIRSKI